MAHSRLCLMLMHLESRDVSRRTIPTILLPVPLLTQTLDLEDNGISWQQALRLSALPNLTRLQLSNNHITEVTYPAAAQPLPSACPAAALPSAATGAATHS